MEILDLLSEKADCIIIYILYIHRIIIIYNIERVLFCCKDLYIYLSIDTEIKSKDKAEIFISYL